MTDLHIHSNFSDGSDSPKELIDNVVKNDIRTFALTDHDTVAGCVEVEKTVPEGFRFIKGIEFSTVCSTLTKCHIIGLGMDIENPDFLRVLDEGRKMRNMKFERRIKMLEDLYGIYFTDEEMAYFHSLNTVAKPHIANMLIKKGAVRDKEQAMEMLRACKDENDKISYETAIFGISSGGGVPVFAHPIGGEGEKHRGYDETVEYVKLLKNAGLIGMECFYSEYNKDEINMLLGIANEFDLKVSGGSDYHGTNKNIHIGRLSDCGLTFDDNLFTVLDML